MNSLRSTFCLYSTTHPALPSRVPQGIHLRSGRAGTLSFKHFSLRVFVVRLSEIISYRPTEKQRTGEAPLKRAGNHHLYNCFNLDIQIGLRLNVYLSLAIYTRSRSPIVYCDICWFYLKIGHIILSDWLFCKSFQFSRGRLVELCPV